MAQRCGRALRLRSVDRVPLAPVVVRKVCYGRRATLLSWLRGRFGVRGGTGTR